MLHRRLHVLRPFCGFGIYRRLHNAADPALNPFESSRDPQQVLQEYGHVLEGDGAEEVALRPQLYQFLKQKGFQNLDVDILAKISPKNRHLFDYKFICDYLLHQQKTDLAPCLGELAVKNPVYTEILLNYTVRKLLAAGEIDLAVHLFAETLLELEVNTNSLSKYNNGKYMESLKQLAGSPEFAGAVAQLASTNLVLASRLSSAVLKHFLVINDPTVIKEMWKLKSKLKMLVARDLHWIMLFYVYIEDPQTALDIYDASPELHKTGATGENLNDALLLASAQALDWDRLQTTFEQIDTGNRTDTNYEITLRALGRLGGPELLDQLHENITSKSRVVSLKVYHALMYSYGKIGNIPKVKLLFEQLCEQQEPVRLTFSILLSAIKHSSELEYAQEIVAKMIGDYQIPMSNGELSQLLSLCASKKDHVTASAIFGWASKLFEPDLASWNAYLHAIDTDGDAIYEAWKQMPHASDIVTLTTVMAPYARYGHKERAEEIMAIKQTLKLKSDLKWLGTVLMYHCQLADVKAAEKTFSELRKLADKQLPGGYYTALMNLYIRVNDLNKVQDLFKLMRESDVAAGMDFYQKYLRVLMAYDEQSGVELAYKVIMNMFKDNIVYDLDSRYIPRTSVPSAVVKPVVRALVRNGQFDQASKLLTMVEDQDLPVLDLWSLSALRIELLHAMENFSLVSFYWVQFTEQIKKAFVPLGENVYALPPSQRHAFWRIINIEIERLLRLGRYTEALKLPEFVSSLGLEMNTKNWNYLVRGLATSGSEGMGIEAYNIAESRLAENWLKSHNSKDKINPLLDLKSIHILHSTVVKTVQALARRNSWSSSEAWSQMLVLYPKINNIFSVIKRKMNHK